ncbi:MAG: L,D-transpeptidase family protein [Candidatus Omnitrophica bacterium]|nr:L,D-transpeptidase family protein [Candidatus Omnitrophota bacterium]
MKKEFFIYVVFLLLIKEVNPFFLILKPEEKARKYFKLSLEEYKKAIRENPNNYEIIEEYTKLLEATIGKTESRIELALIFKELNLQIRVSELLVEILLKDRENALKYIEKRIEKSYDIKEKINLYSIATQLSPQNPLYWYNLGKLLIGINKEKEGVLALEKAYNYNLKDISLFYYLSLYEFNRGDFEKAKFYINEGLKISEDLFLHKMLLKIYLLEKNKEMAKKEREKINELIALKELKGPELKRKKEVIVKKEKIEGPSLPSKYGICAFPLNYPDPIDRRLNKYGNGIWLHATPIEKPPFNSEGCIVVNDSDMKEIMEYIEVGKTFISIFKDNSFLKFPYLKEIIDIVKNWEIGWESKDISKYIDFYDEKFLSDGKDKKEWKLYKERINKAKKYIKIDISDLQILPYGETKFGYIAVAFFKQKYKSDNFSSEVRKILYLVKRDNAWKIICEYTL